VFHHASWRGSAAEATADYFGTATLSDVTVHDPGGEPLPQFEIQAESGFDYGFVPEPATMALLAAGAMAQLGSRSARRTG